jgi:hypothetical protein
MTAPGRRLSDGRDGVVYSPRSEWGYFNKGHQVRVVVPGDPYSGRVGVVQRTFLDGGDMIHVVQFQPEPDDYPPLANPFAYYVADELKSTSVGTKSQPKQQES